VFSWGKKISSGKNQAITYCLFGKTGSDESDKDYKFMNEKGSSLGFGLLEVCDNDLKKNIF
jgi:hypothetical protein